MQNSPSNIINRFLKWLETKGKTPNTILTYQRELKKYQKWLQKYDIDLKDISQRDVQNYIYFLEEQGKSPITNDKIFGVIRTFAKFLKQPEIIFDIQIKNIEKKDKIDILSTEECEHLLTQIKKCENKRNIAIIYTLLHTGIKVSELCALNKSDVDFTNNQLIIKTCTGEQRIIPLSQEVKYHIRKYCNSSTIEDALFISKSNKRLTERSVQYILKKYNVNPHKLRHTFCQQLINKGVNLEIVSKLAGHKDMNVTKKYRKSKIETLKLEEAIQKTFISDTLG